MTARHAGESRIADTALIDQVRAASMEMRAMLSCPCRARTCTHEDGAHCRHRDDLAIHRWAGRALGLLEYIGEMGE